MVDFYRILSKQASFDLRHPISALGSYLQNSIIASPPYIDLMPIKPLAIPNCRYPVTIDRIKVT